MAVYADFSEVERFSHQLDAAALSAAPKAALAVQKTAEDIVATAQRFVPVDTHATQNSIYNEPGIGGLQADIGPTTHYAPYLEYGTVNMAPHAFMGPALDRHAPDLVIALRSIGSSLGTAGRI